MTPPVKCSICGENDIRYKLVLTNTQGEVIAAGGYCAECIIGIGVTGHGAALDLGLVF